MAKKKGSHSWAAGKHEAYISNKEAIEKSFYQGHSKKHLKKLKEKEAAKKAMQAKKQAEHDAKIMKAVVKLSQDAEYLGNPITYDGTPVHKLIHQAKDLTLINTTELSKSDLKAQKFMQMYGGNPKSLMAKAKAADQSNLSKDLHPGNWFKQHEDLKNQIMQSAQNKTLLPEHDPDDDGLNSVVMDLSEVEKKVLAIMDASGLKVGTDMEVSDYNLAYVNPNTDLSLKDLKPGPVITQQADPNDQIAALKAEIAELEEVVSDQAAEIENQKSQMVTMRATKNSVVNQLTVQVNGLQKQLKEAKVPDPMKTEQVANLMLCISPDVMDEAMKKYQQIMASPMNKTEDAYMILRAYTHMKRVIRKASAMGSVDVYTAPFDKAYKDEKILTVRMAETKINFALSPAEKDYLAQKPGDLMAVLKDLLMARSEALITGVLENTEMDYGASEKLGFDLPKGAW